MSKPFDIGLYAEDDDAKEQVIRWLERKGFRAWVNPDRYGIDVLAEYDATPYAFEVEVKHNWDGAKFTFDTVHFSARKLKFAEGNSFFTMLNHQRDRMLMVDAETVRRSPVVSKNTVYTRGEQFVAVPKTACMAVRLN